MPTPKRGPRLGGGPAHQKQILANLASDLIRHGRIKTTETKAKTLRPYAERLITKAKAGDLAARRQVQSKLRDRDVVAYLFEEVAPRFADRPGGYTRILKLGPRPGDNARMAIIELVDRGEGSGDEVIEEGKQARSRGLFGRRRRGASAPATAAAPAIEEVEEPAEDEASSEDAADEPVAEDEVSEDDASSEDVDGADADDADDESADADAESADAESAEADAADDESEDA